MEVLLKRVTSSLPQGSKRNEDDMRYSMPFLAQWVGYRVGVLIVQS